MITDARRSTATPVSLFQAYGVELEYMIVDATTLDVRPITDRLLHSVAGRYEAEVELGELAWSNELALHVVELKTNGPAPSLAPLAGIFQEHIRRVNSLLQPIGARLMPTAMHPWMDPDREMKLWPHEYNPVYEAYHRIFNCRGHGWANLQSLHLNLPFDGDQEFGQLHAAIRLLLPILPALAASSPIADGKATGMADYRMEVYRHNSRRVPSLAGAVVPEAVFTRTDYDQRILQPMYQDMALLDPQGTLRHEWLNSRGAIARFDRSTIEIRVLDVQECPAADLAICSVVARVLQVMTRQRWTGLVEQQSFGVRPLAELFCRAIRDAEQTIVDDPRYLAQFGISESSLPAGDLWRRLAEQVVSSAAEESIINRILDAGPLARRIQRALAGDMSRLQGVYRKLCDCLAEGTLFV